MGSISAFTDSDSVASWALDAAGWNIGSGLIVGSGGKLSPTSNITHIETKALALKPQNSYHHFYMDSHTQ